MTTGRINQIAIHLKRWNFFHTNKKMDFGVSNIHSPLAMIVFRHFTWMKQHMILITLCFTTKERTFQKNNDIFSHILSLVYTTAILIQLPPSMKWPWVCSLSYKSLSNFFIHRLKWKLLTVASWRWVISYVSIYHFFCWVK